MRTARLDDDLPFLKPQPQPPASAMEALRGGDQAAVAAWFEQQRPAFNDRSEERRRLSEGLDQAIRQLGPLESYAEQPLGCPLKARELLDLFQTDPLNFGFGFRGESASTPTLRPWIERVPSFAAFNEGHINTLFRSRAHHYQSNLPAEDAEMEWLALMQHHGAPTKLLDWTFSPYVATFFALESSLESSREEPKPDVVWAADFGALYGHADQVLRQEHAAQVSREDPKSSPDAQKTILNRNLPARPVVIPIRPPRMNERLSVQQGFFMYADPRVWPFETCLRYVLSRVLPQDQPVLYKLQIDPSARLELLTELDRMNINSASLFPGLDGFSRYLRTAITINAAQVQQRWDRERRSFDSGA